MSNSKNGFRAALLCGAAAFVIAPSAHAASTAATNAKIEALEKEVQQLSSEVEDLKKQNTPAQPVAAPAADQVQDVQAQVQDLKRSTSAQYADIQAQAATAPKATIDNGRPTISSGDGKFTASIRALGQFDTAYYSQSAKAAVTNAPDLSSGSNFRRAQLGVQGKVFGDWSYYFNYDFASSAGSEAPGHIQSLYAEYDGLKPFAVRIGAYPPSASLEDATSSADTIFLERNSPADAARNIAGGDGRDAVSLMYMGDEFFASLSLTGDKIADTGVFDEQTAFLGRVADLVYSDSDIKLALSGSGTYVFKVADNAAGIASTRLASISDPPELTVDNGGIKLVSTGNLQTSTIGQWAVEAAGEFDSLYTQAGYFRYDIDQKLVGAPTFNFDGWYAQATWILTGETRPYNTATASFTAPKPDKPFSFKDGGGWGALELAGRYSVLDLNDHAGAAGTVIPVNVSLFPVGLRGGEQDIWTAGLNWYPNQVIRFELQYQNIDIGRMNSSGAKVGQRIDTVALRSQISL
jgi:phosphate-selective porin OprO and OprP